MNKTQLFLLHYAGGNRYSFRFMFDFLKDFEVVPLELPGRGDRMGEQLLTNFDQAAADCCRRMAARLRSPKYIIYGHSMGACLGLRITGLMEERSRPPAYLVVSGNPGPGIGAEKERYLLSREDLIADLKKLGGVPQQVIENEELLEFILPILRADFEVAERNGMESEPPVNTPIHAIMGDEEEYVENIFNWQRFTCGRLDCETMRGGHFFIFDHAEKIASIIKHK